jgi:hypothetical protein
VTLAEAGRQYQDALEAHRIHDSVNTLEQVLEARQLLGQLWVKHLFEVDAPKHVRHYP